MKYIVLLSFLFFAILSSCRRSDHADSQKEREASFQRFHGKYKILSSRVEQALDLNFDGVASIDLKDELPNLVNCNLEIRVPKNTQINFFIEFWPEQVFGGGNGAAPAAYDPGVEVHYPNQSVARTFQFSTDRTAMLLDEDHAGIDQQRHTRPETVIILPGDRIEVVKRKRIYTTAGWREVRVVTLYERYTMET